jgi:hypothetical protein
VVTNSSVGGWINDPTGYLWRTRAFEINMRKKGELTGSYSLRVLVISEWDWRRSGELHLPWFLDTMRAGSVA